MGKSHLVLNPARCWMGAWKPEREKMGWRNGIWSRCGNGWTCYFC